jgi:hypothetical protein
MKLWQMSFNRNHTFIDHPQYMKIIPLQQSKDTYNTLINLQPRYLRFMEKRRENKKQRVQNMLNVYSAQRQRPILFDIPRLNSFAK